MPASHTSRLNLVRASHHTLEGLYAKHHHRSNVLYLVVVLALLGGTVALPFIHVDVGRKANAILQTTAPPTPIIAGASGKVVFSNLRTNNLVQPGDTLLVIDGSRISTKTNHLETEVTRCQEAIQDLSLLTAIADQDEYPQLLSSVYQKDYQDYRQQLDEAQLKIAYATRQLERQETLYATQTIAAVEIERYRFEHQMALSGKMKLQDRQHHLWTQQLASKRRELREYQADLSALYQQTATHTVVATAAGNLLNVYPILTGSYLEAGTVITEISPASELELAVSVSPADIGMIRPGMKVNVEISAFAAARWGFAQGTVREISRDVTTTENGQPYFLVKCNLTDKTLQLPTGHQGQLKKGMTATAHFVLARRSLFQLLQDSVEDWFPASINTQQ